MQLITYTRALIVVGLLTALSQAALAGAGARNDVFAFALGLGEFSPGVAMGGRWLAFTVSETDHGWQDLNGDGEVRLHGDGVLPDNVVHVHDLATGQTKNLGLVSNGRPFEITGRWLVFTVAEAAQGGEDLNGSGTVGFGENVLHAYDLLTGEIVNVGVAVYHEYDGYYVAIDGDRVAFSVAEHLQNQDLDGDGIISPRQGNPWLSNRVAHIYDLESEELVNLGIAGQVVEFSGDYVVIAGPGVDNDGLELARRRSRSTSSQPG